MQTLRAACVALALFFLYALIVQFNDDDKLFWISIYGAALCSCALCAKLLPDAERVLLLITVTAFAAISWTAMLVPQLVKERETFTGALFDSELAREVSGLVIVCAAMAFLYVAVKRSRKFIGSNEG